MDTVERDEHICCAFMSFSFGYIYSEEGVEAIVLTKLFWYSETLPTVTYLDLYSILQVREICCGKSVLKVATVI